MTSGAIVITGASRGIGAVTAQLAAARGFAVAVNYVRDSASAEAVVKQIAEAGGRACAIQADVGVEADIRRLFDDAQRELGPIRGLVNNAGVVDGLGRVDAVTAAQLEHIFRVNVIGAMLCAREAVCRMSTRYGGAGGGSSTSHRWPRASAEPANGCTTLRPRARLRRSREAWRAKSPPRASG